MPTFIKHVGQVSSSGKKCVFVFRRIPGYDASCLVVETEGLPELYHDTLIEAVESSNAQAEPEFYNFASRSVFHDGSNMLQGMHKNGWLRKLSTTEVTMMPTPEIKIKLSDLNEQLDQVTTEPESSKGVLSDKQIAAQMRSQADFFRRESERLLKEAEELDPQPSAKTKKATEDTPKKTPRSKKN